MPEPQTIQRAKRKKAEGKAPSTQAGEFVREEMHHAREGKHDVKSRKQAIAIGLSKARQAGVELPPPPGQRRKKKPTRKKSTGRKAKRKSAKKKARGHR